MFRWVSNRKLGAARDSLARFEFVNVFERLRKFDHHSESDFKLVILNNVNERAVKNEDQKREKHNKDWKKRSQDSSAQQRSYCSGDSKHHGLVRFV